MFERSDAEIYVAQQRPVELDLAKSTVRRSVVVGPVIVVLATLIRGWDGAWSAALGIVIVVGYYLITGVFLSMAARISFAAYYAGALFGFIVRLGLIAATMYLLASILPVDRVVLGVSVVVAYLALLVLEVKALAGERREDHV
ncbi:MAG: hypothetical protein OEM81_10675 [Acidimicrobiia bacterium]|nr:hypothetical protein [Acidimicrobiia bacterium]MDH3398281.1 hypothetical protein [Acidimicrobiia bacterium]MDH5615697.1 hypothetical protein [Acidimicrobiia bacterium]